jgi:hypothetical protein
MFPDGENALQAICDGFDPHTVHLFCGNVEWDCIFHQTPGNRRSWVRVPPYCVSSPLVPQSLQMENEKVTIQLSRSMIPAVVKGLLDSGFAKEADEVIKIILVNREKNLALSSNG